MNSILWRLICILLLATPVAAGNPQNIAAPNDDCVPISHQASKLVGPILSKRLESRDNPYTSKAAEELGQLLYVLRTSQEPEADEAMCALLNFYLGEANDEDVMFSVTSRGKRVISVLESYLSCPPCVRPDFKGLLLREEDRKESIQMALRAIRREEIIGVD